MCCGNMFMLYTHTHQTVDSCVWGFEYKLYDMQTSKIMNMSAC